MPIDKSSRYARTDTAVVPDSRGEEAEMLLVRDIPRVDGVFHATPIETDRLDLLAYRYYRDATKFWKICDASDHLDPFDVMEPGEPLLVPPNR